MNKTDAKMLSMGEQDALVRNAFDRWYYGQMPMGEEMDDIAYCWVTEVYPEYAIVCAGQGLYYQVSYTMSADGVTFQTQSEWIRVEKDWTPAKTIDTLVYQGGDIKTFGNGKVGGYLVRFNGRDLDGEYFTEKTYFGAMEGDGADCCFHHMMPIKAGLEEYSEHLFTPLKTKRDELGIFAETVLDMSDEYEKLVYDLVEKGKLKWSSGTSGHMARRTKDGEITRWPIIEGSFTPTPAEPRNHVMPVKSLKVSSEMGDIFNSLITPENKPAKPDVKPDAKAAETVARVKSQPKIEFIPSNEVKKMENENTAEVQAVEGETITLSQAELDARIQQAAKSAADAAASKAIETYINRLENTPKAEGKYISNTGGASDPQVKSLGDFCLAVKRKDFKRLSSVYQAQSAEDYDRGMEAKALGEDQGATGGYMVPPSFSAELVTAQSMISPILNMVRTIPVTSPAGDWPVLDVYRTVTAGSGNTAMAGGLISSVIAEGGTFTDRNVYFRQISWRVAKVGDILNVPSEIAEDAPALETLLRQVMTTTLAARKEYGILRGTGVGEPLGIINAPALISYNPATSNVFAYGDSVGMIARLKMLGGDANRVAFLHHISVLPDVASFQTGSAGTSLVQSISGTDPSQLALWTKRLIQSEHLPQADNDNSVILADLGAYGIWQRGAISIAYSTDYAFNTDEVTWRFKERYDGRPLAVSTLTLADPQGSYTQSPFVGLLATHS